MTFYYKRYRNNLLAVTSDGTALEVHNAYVITDGRDICMGCSGDLTGDRLYCDSCGFAVHNDCARVQQPRVGRYHQAFCLDCVEAD